MTLAAFLGSALPYALVVIIVAVAWLYFNVVQPWLNRRRSRNQRKWDIHAR